MRFLVYAVIGLTIALSSLSALGQSLQPDFSEPIDTPQGFALFQEQVAFNRALFSGRNLPMNCRRSLRDPSLPATRENFIIICNGPITWCDGVENRCRK